MTNLCHPINGTSRSRSLSITRSRQLQASLHLKNWSGTCSRKTNFNTSPMFQQGLTRGFSAKTGSISGSRTPIAGLTRLQMNSTSLNASRFSNTWELQKLASLKTSQSKRLLSNFRDCNRAKQACPCPLSSRSRKIGRWKPRDTTPLEYKNYIR